MENLILLPFVNNLVMSALKWSLQTRFIDVANRDWRLRVALVIMSLIGVVSTAALNGTPVDPNSVTSLTATLVEVLTIALASHLSYKVVKSA